MEQDERVYEYIMGSDIFRFEARNHEEALEMRGSAIQHFAETLGAFFDEDAMRGPNVAEMPVGFRYVEGSPKPRVASPMQRKT